MPSDFFFLWIFPLEENFQPLHFHPPTKKILTTHDNGSYFSCIVLSSPSSYTLSAVPCQYSYLLATLRTPLTLLNFTANRLCFCCWHCLRCVVYNIPIWFLQPDETRIFSFAVCMHSEMFQWRTAKPNSCINFLTRSAKYCSPFQWHYS